MSFCSWYVQVDLLFQSWYRWSSASVNRYEVLQNATWYSIKTTCDKCGQTGITRATLHKLFNCKQTKISRKNIINSLITEIENYYSTQKNKNKALTNSEKISWNDMTELRAPLQSNIGVERQLNYINILMGNTLHENNPHKEKLVTILNSHLILLTQTISDTITSPNEYIEVW